MANPSSRIQTPSTPRAPRSSFFSAFSAASALIVAIVVVLAAQTPDRARTEAMAKRAGERIVALQREADRLATEEGTLLNNLRKLEIERQIRAAELKDAESGVADVQAAIAAATERIDGLQQTSRTERPELNARLVEMYKMGRARYARVLLGAPDLRRLGQASRTVAAMAKLDRDRIADHQRTLDALKQERAALDTRQKDAVAARAKAEKAQAAAARAAQMQNAMIRDIDQRRDLNAQLAGELQSVQQKLQLALRETGGAAPDAALPLKPFRGDLDWPADGPLHSRYGRTAAAPGSSSNGIEVSAADAAPVRAVHGGTVAFAGNFAGFGNLVILEHGSQSFSLYGDLLDIAVAKGARVDHGQTVGSAGPLPSGGTGVYFELRIDGKPVDPLQWLKKR
jgi:septal ring factor EnvC (AmiA/AmiB activator)